MITDMMEGEGVRCYDGGLVLKVSEFNSVRG